MKKNIFQLLIISFIFSLIINQKITNAQQARIKCKDEKFMRLIPGGSFIMGSRRNSEEFPPHRVTVKSFYMDETEVTFEEYEKFIKETGYKPKGKWKNDFKQDRSKHPVTNVTYFDAEAYAKWAGKRIPNEQEWEYAAGGPAHTVYDFGNSWVRTAAALWDPRRKISVPVRSYKPNGYGLFDMTGNVKEWTSSKFVPYPGGKKVANMDGNFFVVKGGCFLFFDDQSRNQARHAAKPDFSYNALGFRCAKDITN